MAFSYVIKPFSQQMQKERDRERLAGRRGEALADRSKGKMTEQRESVPGTQGAAPLGSGRRCWAARGEKPGCWEVSSTFVAPLAGIHK